MSRIPTALFATLLAITLASCVHPSTQTAPPLPGTWLCGHEPIQYVFRPDGTYTVSDVSNPTKPAISEKGTWKATCHTLQMRSDTPLPQKPQTTKTNFSFVNGFLVFGSPQKHSKEFLAEFGSLNQYAQEFGYKKTGNP